MNNKKIDLSNFDFNKFKADALSQLKSGQYLRGKGVILTPLIKEFLEAALEGEMGFCRRKFQTTCSWHYFL